MEWIKKNKKKMAETRLQSLENFILRIGIILTPEEWGGKGGWRGRGVEARGSEGGEGKRGMI